MSPHYLVKLKTADRFLQFVLSNRLLVTFTESRSMFVFMKLYSSLLENYLGSFLAGNFFTFSYDFIKNFLNLAY